MVPARLVQADGAVHIHLSARLGHHFVQIHYWNAVRMHDSGRLAVEALDHGIVVEPERHEGSGRNIQELRAGRKQPTGDVFQLLLVQP